MIGLVAGSALIASTVVGAGIYMMSKPKTEMGIDKNAERVAPRDMPKSPM
ncbi:MAG: hypothetical protein KTV72_00710 [Wolbachia endosymbiont of Melophagus ovinus]|nr:hypothetical protein [Wolbachia endosymbiont of Melophagus ovinus]